MLFNVVSTVIRLFMACVVLETHVFEFSFRLVALLCWVAVSLTHWLEDKQV